MTTPERRLREETNRRAGQHLLAVRRGFAALRKVQQARWQACYFTEQGDKDRLALKGK